MRVSLATSYLLGVASMRYVLKIEPIASATEDEIVALVAPAVQAAAARTGKSPAQVVLRWHVQLGCSVIPRSTRAAGLAENLNLWDFDLAAAEMAAIVLLDAGERTGPDPLLFS